ncbi:MAG: hypothetical protein ACRDND_34110 [Streptosporangiaceae bacterium]
MSGRRPHVVLRPEVFARPHVVVRPQVVLRVQLVVPRVWLWLTLMYLLLTCRGRAGRGPGNAC